MFDPEMTPEEQEAYADEMLREQVEESKDFFFADLLDPYDGPMGIFTDMYEDDEPIN